MPGLAGSKQELRPPVGEVVLEEEPHGFESRPAAPEDRHGVAIIPSAVRASRYRLKVASVIFQRKPLREPLAIFWDKQRTLPPYAAAFCDLLASYMRDAFPVTRPPKPVRGKESARSP